MVKLQEFKIVGKIYGSKCCLLFVQATKPLASGDGYATGKCFVPLESDVASLPVGRNIKGIEVKGNVEVVSNE